MTQEQTRKTGSKIVTLILFLGGSLGAFFALSYFPHSTELFANDRIIKQNEDTYEAAYNQFLSKFGKSYLTREEYLARLVFFRANLKYIEEHNQQPNQSYKLEVNLYTDWSDTERNWLSLNSGLQESQKGEKGPKEIKLSLPTSIDWRQQGAVTSVKKQGGCNGCYAFSAAGAIEGAYKLKTGKLVDFSPQQLIDCTQSAGNQACRGGWQTNCYDYLKDNKLVTIDSYPYTGKAGSCKYQSGSGIVNVKSYVQLPEKDPAALMQAVAQRPVSVAVNSQSGDFFFYKSGIISSEKCGKKVNHAVLLIGYGSDNGQDFWLLKNSFGASWGEKGYFKILRTNQKGDAGICGILSPHSNYPIVE